MNRLLCIVMVTAILRPAPSTASTIEEDIARGLSISEIVAAAIARGEEPRKIASRIFSEANDHPRTLAPAGYTDTLQLRDSLVANGVPAAEAESIIAKNRLRGLCMHVGDRERLREPIQGADGRPYVWRYQAKLFEAALVDVSKDDRDAIARKVSRVWEAHEDMLVCNNTRFDVINGSVIKYAVNLKFDEFLLDLAAWKVDLNRVDRFDNRTVLDYVAYQMERMKGTPSETILKRYDQLLRAAGAKHLGQL